MSILQILKEEFGIVIKNFNYEELKPSTESEATVADAFNVAEQNIQDAATTELTVPKKQRTNNTNKEKKKSRSSTSHDSNTVDISDLDRDDK